MAVTFLDRAKMTVASAPGTGAITLGTAVSSFRTFAAAGLADQATVSYTIEDGSNYEFGRGTYTASGTSLARTTILGSSNSGNAINASSNATVYASLLAEDVASFGGIVAACAFTLNSENVITVVSQTNISSVTRISAGVYTLVFSKSVGPSCVPMSAATYGPYNNQDDIFVTYGRNSGNNPPDDPTMQSGVTLHMREPDSNSGIVYDAAYVRFMMIDPT